MTLEAKVLRDSSLRSVPGGYEVDVHLAWYRSLPLSCVENISISVAGHAFARQDLAVSFEGALLSLDELEERIDDWWFVQDPLTVKVSCAQPLARGSRAELAVEIATRVPYVIIGPDMALVQRTAASREVTIQ